MRQSDPESLKAGDLLARRYLILSHLREEPCGAVWLAQDRLLGQDVGLKFVSRREPRFEAIREALRREAALALKFHHAHLLGVLHFDEGEEGAYLIQEPFAGESLVVRLSRLERFRMPQALNLLEQAAQALASLHEHHEVHQTLDPFHLLVRDHTVKLANLACIPEAADDQVTHLELKAYVAPEVLQGEPVTPAANVFSLGVLGFRLIAGSLPYPLTFDEPFPYRLDSMPADLEEIPLPLQNLLLQCLAAEPQERFEDAGAFVAALEQRREHWRTPSHDKWSDWTPEPRSGIAGTGGRVLGQIWERGKSAAGKIGEEVQRLKSDKDPGTTRRWLLSLAGVILALLALVWAGKTLLHQAEAPPPPPAPTLAKLPPVGGPPLNAPADPPPASAPPAAAASPRPDPGPEAQVTTAPRGERYQVLVATYASYDQAKAMKKRLQDKKVPAMVSRSTSDKKTFFVVKAGPFDSKKLAEETGRRLKSEERLPHAPKVVKITAAAPKTALKKASP